MTIKQNDLDRAFHGRLGRNKILWSIYSNNISIAVATNIFT